MESNRINDPPNFPSDDSSDSEDPQTHLFNSISKNDGRQEEEDVERKLIQQLGEGGDHGRTNFEILQYNFQSASEQRNSETLTDAESNSHATEMHIQSDQAGQLDELILDDFVGEETRDQTETRETESRPTQDQSERDSGQTLDDLMDETQYEDPEDNPRSLCAMCFSQICYFVPVMCLLLSSVIIDWGGSCAQPLPVWAIGQILIIFFHIFFQLLDAFCFSPPPSTTSSMNTSTNITPASPSSSDPTSTDGPTPTPTPTPTSPDQSPVVDSSQPYSDGHDSDDSESEFADLLSTSPSSSSTSSVSEIHLPTQSATPTQFPHDSDPSSSQVSSTPVRYRRSPWVGLIATFHLFVKFIWFVWFILGMAWIFDPSSKDQCAQEVPTLYKMCLTVLISELVFVLLGVLFICCSFFGFVCYVLHSDYNSQNTRAAASVDQINSLKKVAYQEGSIDPDHITCAICLSDYTQDEELRYLPCDHHYHSQCVDQWLLINNTCPQCKHPISEKQKTPSSSTFPAVESQPSTSPSSTTPSSAATEERIQDLEAGLGSSQQTSTITNSDTTRNSENEPASVNLTRSEYFDSDDDDIIEVV